MWLAGRAARVPATDRDGLSLECQGHRPAAPQELDRARAEGGDGEIGPTVSIKVTGREIGEHTAHAVRENRNGKSSGAVVDADDDHPRLQRDR